MASFSFGAGNAGKLARIPLFVLGRLATLVVPRSPQRWVYACAVGVTDGALALWRASDRDGRVWLTTTPEQDAAAAALGIPTVRRDSWRGFWATARAGAVIVTHGLGDANRYAVSGAFVVQLWHGIPLKRLGLDTVVTADPGPWRRVPGARRLLQTLYRRAQRQIRLLPAASHLVRGRLESAFGLSDDRVRVLGEPRVDVLSQGTPEARRDRGRRLIEDVVGDLTGARIVLYAPTWRDGARDPAVPSAAEWAALDAMLREQDAVLLVRSHPLGAGDYTPPVATPRVRAIGSASIADITPALPGLDVLLTDYSSLAYDAALVPVPTVFLAPDVAAYARSRGFYGRYDDVAPDAASDWTAAIAQLRAVLADPDEAARRRRRGAALSARVHAWHDGGNAARVHRAILGALAPGGEERE